MYKFKQIKAKYNFISDALEPSGKHSTYSMIEHISALPNLIEGLNFTLCGITNELIDGNPLQDFNLIMSQLGQSLYPIELNVLKTGKIKKLKNLEDIQKRWKLESEKILSTYENAYWVERYINMTSKNLVNEDSFMKALVRNSFIQLFFMEEAALQQRIQIYDFPFNGNTLNVIFDGVNSDNSEYHYNSVLESTDECICSGKGEMVILYSAKGLPLKISFFYRIEVADEGYYTKRVNIELID